MNWALPLIQLLYNVTRRYAQSGQGVRHGIEDHSDGDWQQRMVALSTTGATLLHVKPDSAMFDLEIQGSNYAVVLLRRGGTVLITLCSCITFPRGRAPRDVSAGLSRMNRQLERCDYELLHGDNGDFYCVQCQINLERLSPDTFYAGVNNMLPHVMMLDKYLLENDYAR